MHDVKGAEHHNICRTTTTTLKVQSTAIFVALFNNLNAKGAEHHNICSTYQQPRR